MGKQFSSMKKQCSVSSNKLPAEDTDSSTFKAKK